MSVRLNPPTRNKRNRRLSISARQRNFYINSLSVFIHFTQFILSFFKIASFSNLLYHTLPKKRKNDCQFFCRIFYAAFLKELFFRIFCILFKRFWTFLGIFTYFPFGVKKFFYKNLILRARHCESFSIEHIETHKDKKTLSRRVIRVVAKHK
jgi:hypothetical protein